MVRLGRAIEQIGSLMPLIRALITALSLFCLTASVPAQAPPSFHAARVGPVEVQLPVPAGFSEATSLSPRLRELGETFTPPSNRLLAFYLSNGDLKLLANAEPPVMDRYFMIQTLRATERDVISLQDMTAAKNILRNQHKSTLARLQPLMDAHMAAASKKLGSQVGAPELSIKAGEVLPLEIFDERSNSLSWVMLNKIAVNTGTLTREIPLVVAMTTMTMRGKLVYFFVYSHYNGQADIDWARAATMEWLASLP
jgi:hypothetical protein